jgi:O-antigen/teichoic acid export membrane protein
MSGVASVTLLVAMVLVRTAALLGLMKLLALWFGTEGFGQLSQVLAIAALFAVLAGGGLTNGIVRNLAASANPVERAGWIKAALPIAAVSALVMAAIAVVMYLTAAGAIFPGEALGFVLIVIAAVQAVVGFGNIALAYLSGTHDVRAYATANGGGSIAAAGLVAVLAWLGVFRGAAIGCAALALMPALFALVSAARRTDWPTLGRAAIDRARVLALLRFGGSMYLAAAAVPLVWVYVRSDLALRQGWEAVGLWQAVTRISDAYMQVFGMIFMNYALPQFAAAALPSERLHRLRDTARLVFALFFAGAAVLYVGRDVILRLAFSAEFTDAATYLGPQIAGDAFKLVSLVFVYYLMSLNHASVLASMELLQAAVILIVYLLLVPSMGDRAAVTSYAAATLIVMTATLGLVAANRARLA